MKRILTAAVLIPLVLLAVFKAPNWLFTLLVGAVAILALKEYLDLVEAYGVKPMRWLTYGYVGVTYVSLTAMNAELLLSLGVSFQTTWQIDRKIEIVGVVFGLFWTFVFLFVAIRKVALEKAFFAAALSGFGVFYVGFALLALPWLRREGWFPVLFTFLAVWAGDTVAMYTGKAIGRHKMSPRISPNKTWEGAIGSILGSVAFCLLMTYLALTHHSSPYDGSLSMLQAAIAALIINVAAQLGDLVESLIKRGAGVKDSGTLLPGHGGILDRIDALLFAAPVALVVFAFLR